MIALEQIEDAIEDNIGFCIECKSEKECCESDADGIQCDECGEFKVYGALNLLAMNLVY